jgi:tetratricopeptide (TPR) repeat protein
MSVSAGVMLFLCAVVTAVEIFLVRNLAASPSDWVLPVTTHLAISGGLLALAGLRTFREDRMWPLLAGITVATTGPIGAAGTMTAILLTVFHRRKSDSFEDWYESLFPESLTDTGADLMARIRSKESAESQGVAAFADILAFGTVAQKRELITLMTKHFEPKFAGVLKMALDDSNNATRVQAASAVAKIQDEFTSRSVALKQSVSSRDPVKVLELARHFDEHARTGLLDPEGSNASRKSALEAYRRYLELDPQDAKARAAVGRLLLQSGKFDEACTWLKESVEKGGAPPEGVTAYMEALFRLRRYNELRAVAQKHSPQSESWNANDESAEALKLWAEGYDAV